jgi:hypothetical protein
VTLVTLDRPEVLNAMTTAMHAGLGELWPDLGRDPATRAIAITGGGRAFSAGNDLRQPDPTPANVPDLARRIANLVLHALTPRDEVWVPHPLPRARALVKESAQRLVQRLLREDDAHYGDVLGDLAQQPASQLDALSVRTDWRARPRRAVTWQGVVFLGRSPHQSGFIELNFSSLDTRSTLRTCDSSEYTGTSLDWRSTSTMPPP